MMLEGAMRCWGLKTNEAVPVFLIISTLISDLVLDNRKANLSLENVFYKDAKNVSCLTKNF